MNFMNELESLQDDLRIATHNVWVAKTVVDDKESEVAHAEHLIFQYKVKTAKTNIENKLKTQIQETIKEIQDILDQDGYGQRETDGQ